MSDRARGYLIQAAQPATIPGMWPDASRTDKLLSAARAGDSDAVNKLFEEHRESVRRMIELRLDPAIVARVDASDIVQDTLVEASRRLDDYLRSSDMPFHLWIRQIAKDRMIDAHRRHRAAGRRSVERERPLDRPGFSSASSIQLLNQLQSEGLTPATQAIRQEMEAQFSAALEELEEVDREILLMRHFEQLSNQESARALKLSDPAASMRYLRALRRLRAKIGVDDSQADKRPQ